MSLSTTTRPVGARDSARLPWTMRMPASSQPSTSSLADPVILASVASTESCASRSRAIDAIC